MNGLQFNCCIIATDAERAKKNEHKQLLDLQVKFDLLEEDFVVQKAQVKNGRGGGWGRERRGMWSRK